MINLTAELTQKLIARAERENCTVEALITSLLEPDNLPGSESYASRLTSTNPDISYIMDASPAGICVVETTGEITFANLRAQQIFRLSKKEITSRSYDAPDWKHTDVDGGPWPDEKQPFVRVMQTKAPVYGVQHGIEWPDGSRIILSINGVPVLDDAGEIMKLIFTIEDITERKASEIALETAYEKEKHLNAVKSRFIAMMTHDFRTPLSTILTSANTLQLFMDKLNPDQQHRQLQHIENAVHHLEAMLAEVMAIGRGDIEGLTFTPQPLDLEKLCDTVIYEIQQFAKQAQRIVFTNNAPFSLVMADSNLLRHILVNLLSNAVKYSPVNTPVYFSLNYEADYIVFVIEDHGIGIPEEDHASLFESFYRGQNVGEIRGTGLGLAIVKQAVDTHNGLLEFVSHPGKGTTFTVKIPLMREISPV